MNMMTKSPLFKGKNRVLSREEIESFGAKIEAIRAEVTAKIGQEDADYVYKVRDFVRYTEIASRTMLMFGGWVPPVWLFATAMLGVSKIVENMELGHNVMHGQFDWMNDPSLNGATYDWDSDCPAIDWKEYHNHIHHTYTNIIGKDRDVGYTLIRVTPEQRWSVGTLFNIPKATLLSLLFSYGVGVHGLHQEELLEGKISLKEFLHKARPTARKFARQFGKDYVFFPLLAAPTLTTLPVLAGNVGANIIRNVWAFAIIFCGHFTANSEFFSEDILKDETRADWYLRQIKGSSNLSGGKLFHFMSGNLSHQIEHHLFPDLPANRYAEMAVKVRAVCDEYQQHYNTGSFAKQFGEVIGRIALYSLPNSAIERVVGVKETLQRLRGNKRKFAGI